MIIHPRQSNFPSTLYVKEEFHEKINVQTSTENVLNYLVEKNAYNMVSIYLHSDGQIITSISATY